MRKISLLLCFLMILSVFPVLSVYAAHDPYMGIEMTAYDDAVGVSDGFSADTRGFIRNLRGSAYVVFKKVNFGENGPKSVEFYSACGTGSEIGITSVFLDDPESTPIAQLQNVAGDWITQDISTAEITQEITGVHDVILKNTTGVCNMFKLVFYEKAGAGAGVVYKEGDYFDDIADSPYRSEINMFYEMGILNGFSETKYEPKLYLSRGDFCALFYRIMGTEGASENPFTDVAADYYNRQAISWMYENGLISLNEDKLFRPYEYITTQEAAAIGVRLLGYEVLAQKKGGWPNGYMIAAHELDLFDGINAGRVITRGEIAKFLYNFVHADYLDVDVVTSQGVKYIKKNGITSQGKGIYTDRGIVSATPITGLKVIETGLNKKSVMIDGERFDGSSTAAASLLGYEVDYYYYEEDGEKVLTNVRPASSTQVTTLLSNREDITAVSETGITYYDEDGKERKLKFDSSTAFLYNGKAADKPLSQLLGNGDFSGKITYVDNRGADTVIIERHETVIIGSIDSLTNTVYGTEKDQQFSFDSNKADAIIYLNDEAVSFAQLKAGMLLSVFESGNDTGNKRIVAKIEENTVSGTVTQVADDTVCIGEEEYIFNMADGTVMALGLSGNFRLNYMGDVVAFDRDDSLDTNFKMGMLLDYGDFSKGLSSSLKLKIFTTDNTEVIYSCADKIEADGVKIKAAENLLDGSGVFAGLNSVAKKTLVRYKLNKAGEVSVLDTCLTGTESENDRLVKLSSTSAGYYFNTYTHSILSGEPERDNNNPTYIKGKTMFVYDDAPAVFAFSSAGDDEPVYLPNLMSVISADTKATGTFYSVTPETNTADYFVWDSRESSIEAKYGSAFVFNKLANVIDKNGEDAIAIHGYTGAAAVEYVLTEEYLSENSVMNNVIRSLRFGDVARFTLDLSDRPKAIEVIYLYDGSEKFTTINGTAISATINNNQALWGDKNSSLQYTRYCYGEVVSRDGDIIKIRCNGFAEDETFYCGGVSVASYNKTTNKILAGLPSSNLIVGSKVLVCISQRQPSLVIRYDN